MSLWIVLIDICTKPYCKMRFFWWFSNSVEQSIYTYTHVLKCLSVLYFLVYFALRQKIELLATPKCPTYICTLLRQQERKGSSSTTLAIKLFLLSFLLHRIELCCNICNIATVNAMLLGQIIAAKRRRCARGGALHKCITWWRLTSPAPPFKAPVYVQDFLKVLSLSLFACKIE